MRHCTLFVCCLDVNSPIAAVNSIKKMENHIPKVNTSLTFELSDLISHGNYKQWLYDTTLDNLMKPSASFFPDMTQSDIKYWVHDLLLDANIAGKHQSHGSENYPVGGTALSKDFQRECLVQRISGIKSPCGLNFTSIDDLSSHVTTDHVDVIWTKRTRRPCMWLNCSRQWLFKAKHWLLRHVRSVCGAKKQGRQCKRNMFSCVILH